MTAPQQLGFGFEQILEEQKSAHLPSAMDEAIPYYWAMIERHHAAMLAGDEPGAMAIRKEAHRLAVKLNDGEPGILADPDSPGYVLARQTHAPEGTVPMWGQTGEYIITVGDMRVRIKQEGMFGTGAAFGIWPGFSANIVDKDKPFPVSETGYRSFLGVHADMVPGLTPDTFAERIIASYVAGQRPTRKSKRSR